MYQAKSLAYLSVFSVAILIVVDYGSFFGVALGGGGSLLSIFLG